MGSDAPDGHAADGEGPVRAVDLDAFEIDVCAVSNARFQKFVAATGHRTDAERFGWSFVFGGLLPDDFAPTRGAAEAPWWRQVHGACWHSPEGTGSTIVDRGDHPVVHVSWNDAIAYCTWAGRRLPTEAEWERAARGGLERKRLPWGDEREPGGEHRMNIWQGSFPDTNSLEDGWLGTCPVDEFPANGLGLHNPCGNVWEWCADWFATAAALRPTGRENSGGPPMGEARVIRGGSYLCHDSYCNRYRVAARSSSTPSSATGNMGFRCALNPNERPNMTEIQRSSLPIPDRREVGLMTYDAKDPDTTFPPIEPLRPPEGAPERAGRPARRRRLRRLQRVRRPMRHADRRAAGRGRPQVQPLPHHRALLADAPGAADRPQPPLGRHGRHHRDRDLGARATARSARRPRRRSPRRSS